MKAHLVMRYTKDGTHAYVDSVYALRHSARSRASELRKRTGVEVFVLGRTLRTTRKIRVEGGVSERRTK